MRKSDEDKRINAPFTQQEPETDQDYTAYKDMLGEPSFAHAGSGPRQAMSAPVDTTHVVRNLDSRKIGHHQMGTSSSKYDHLY